MDVRIILEVHIQQVSTHIPSSLESKCLYCNKNNQRKFTKNLKERFF